MAKKEFTVLKAVKLGGEEHTVGDIVSLEAKTGERLLGTFVEEYVKPEGDAKKGAKKAGDGL